ncbi:MAG: hypothetical protein JO372_09605 [Solirubrobacterales bacterium]|nr:hypothetical protein [Solirubrobacterales bacterium]
MRASERGIRCAWILHAAASPAVVEAEEVHSLASLLQVHDPRLGRFEFEPHIGQDRRERREGVLGFAPGLAQRKQIVGLCRDADYAE